MALSGGASYPRLADERCVEPELGGTVVVTVADEAGVRLPQVPVFLIPLTFGRLGETTPSPPVGAYTDARGQAVLKTTAGFSRYALTSAMGGFVPRVRVFELAAGCSGSAPLTIRLATDERLDALNSGRTVE
jgi:hypothetical protein